MHLSILRSGVLLTLAALGVAAATAQPEFPFAVGVDRTGWAQAQSKADGQVLIESPEYPRGLWLDLVDESGQGLAGLQVDYQGRPDSLVAIRGVDPAGLHRETLLWTRPAGDPLRLALKPGEPADLPAGLVPIDWQIDPAAEELLEPVEETRLSGWEAVAAFLRERWQGQAGRVAVQLDASASLAVELDHPEALETLVAHLQQLHQSAGASLGETTPLEVQVFEGSFALREGVILYTFFFEDSNLETAVRQTLGRPQGPITRQEVASLTELSASHKAIHSLAGLEYFTALQRLYLNHNRLSDVSPLAHLTNLRFLYLNHNRLSDVSPLAHLTNLQELWLNHNRLSDVSPLAHLTNLQELWLNHNRLSDVSPLAHLTNLQELWLNHNRLSDVSPLAHLTNLRFLYLGHNRLSDVSPLAHLTNLRFLWLDDNQIKDINPLVANTGLSEGDSVNLSANPLSDQALTEQIPALEARGVKVRY